MQYETLYCFKLCCSRGDHLFQFMRTEKSISKRLIAQVLIQLTLFNKQFQGSTNEQ